MIGPGTRGGRTGTRRMSAGGHGGLGFDGRRFEGSGCRHAVDVPGLVATGTLSDPTGHCSHPDDGRAPTGGNRGCVRGVMKWCHGPGFRGAARGAAGGEVVVRAEARKACTMVGTVTSRQIREDGRGVMKWCHEAGFCGRGDGTCRRRCDRCGAAGTALPRGRDEVPGPGSPRTVDLPVGGERRRMSPMRSSRTSRLVERPRVSGRRRSEGPLAASLASGHAVMTSGFSRSGLIKKLSSDAGDGYDIADSKVAVDSLNIAWNNEAARSAKQCLSISGFSSKGLFNRLSSSAGDGDIVSQAIA